MTKYKFVILKDKMKGLNLSHQANMNIHNFI